MVFQNDFLFLDIQMLALELIFARPKFLGFTLVMSGNSFALPNYIIPALRELVNNDFIRKTVMIYSNPPRFIVTLDRDLDPRWRISRSGTELLILLDMDEDLLLVSSDNRDQIDDQLTITRGRMPELDGLRLAMVKWKYDGINPVQGQ